MGDAVVVLVEAPLPGLSPAFSFFGTEDERDGESAAPTGFFAAAAAEGGGIFFTGDAVGEAAAAFGGEAAGGIFFAMEAADGLLFAAATATGVFVFDTAAAVSGDEDDFFAEDDRGGEAPVGEARPAAVDGEFPRSAESPLLGGI